MVTTENKNLASLKESLARYTQAMLAGRNRKITNLSAKIAAKVRLSLQKNRATLNGTTQTIERAQKVFIKSKRTQLENFTTTVRLISVANILKKGYAIVRVNGAVVSHTEAIEKGTQIEVIFTDATLQEKIKHDGRDNNL